MGLRDLLFGKTVDANKAAYRDEVKKAVSDGKLTPDKVARLQQLKEELDVTAASQDFTMVRREQYQTAADAMMKGGALSAGEEKELQRIQVFLGLKDQQIAQTKAELGRLRILTDMRAGKFPEISAQNVLMRALKLNEGEIAHWGEIAIFLEGQDAGGTAGVGLKLLRGMAYQAGTANAYTLPLKDANPVEEGHLIMTNQRMVMKGQNKVTSFAYDKPDEINLYKDGIRLRMGKGRAVLFKFRNIENADFMGLLVARGLNPELFGPGGKGTESLDFS